ncbi:helix-turn-helix domain-containing protein [Nocardioides taihuensis]|uniref:Helix-turn-helix domain-containing protein n=1 Tax=Nocardioides taihuensis TaxID=1835606 RepID=A0ABW0BN34_9ACTN
MGDVIAFPRPDHEPDHRPEHRRAPEPEPLWREAVGRELREERQDAGRTLADVAGTAGVSTQYLSEVERGLKEPSSEVLGAVAGALGLRLVDLTARVTRRITSGGISGPVCLAA